jgi:hypothetical protein
VFKRAEPALFEAPATEPEVAVRVAIDAYKAAQIPNALTLCMKVLDERRGRGIHDPLGREADGCLRASRCSMPVPPSRRLWPVHPFGDRSSNFAPAIDRFLEAHLFGDTFLRGNLAWQSRELAAVAALAAIPGVESLFRIDRTRRRRCRPRIGAAIETYLAAER